MKIYILFGCHSANDSWRTECLYICTHWDWLCASVTQTQLMVDFLVAGVMALSTDWLTHNFLQCGIQIPMWLAAWKTHLIFGVQCYTSVCVCMWMCMFVWYVCVCVCIRSWVCLKVFALTSAFWQQCEFMCMISIQGNHISVVLSPQEACLGYWASSRAMSQRE